MVETTKKVTDAQRNADEMVAVGLKENLAMKVASIIERSIAMPIDGLRAEIKGIRAEIKGIRDEIEKLDKKVGWFSGRVAISAILLIIGACGYMSKQIDDLNTDVGEIKGAIVQMEKRFDDQFEQVDTKFEQVDAQFEKVNEKVTKLQVDFARMDERITGIDGRMTRMEGQMTEMQGRMTRVEGTVNQIFEFMKEQARINSSVPEAVPGETDISFDPDQGQPTMKPKEDQIDQIDQIKGKLGSHPTQLGSTPLTKQADVGPDAQPMQAGQPKPPLENKGGGIGGPESYPSE